MEIETLLSKAADSMHAGRSFGPPIEQGDVIIIPVSFVAGGGGGGMGQPAPPRDGSPPKQGEGKGGGFGTVSWPLGVYVVKQDHVRFVPTVDATRIAIAGIGLLKLAAKLRAARRANR